ncbi:hypothetical protein N7491_000342 [Penicillium cf. griseofulvum]|uniref:Uncharacterized protein n=1 Tax=Penicillium cf. griseofulvum TaxID=2972120 RepID=A0A9W9JQX7_9EURO|nr:hypothetical protein N7472_004299 [Penicillium cf. griseofulvum]KAJ5451160.1 hypothetical protein N7491_000342 [Penicillium cf. griseofulvum]
MPSLLFLLALSISINLTSAAHAGFHVQFPWMTRGLNPKTRPGIDPYNPFCGMFLSVSGLAATSRSFLSFSGHPGDLVTALYTQHRVPRKRDDFPYIILQDVPIQPSGQLCVNVTIPFKTKLDEMGVMYFEARDSKTGNLEHYCSDVKMADIEALPEEHPAMCAANNETLIPMPDEYM